MPTKIIVPSELVEQTLARNTVLFVGAGLSIGAGFPGWPDLLRQMMAWAETRGVELSGSKKELRQLVTQGKFLSVAQELRERMGEQRFKAFMELTFRDDTKLPTSVHHILPQIPFAAVLTTNYDVLLESVYAGAMRTHPRAFTQSDTAALSALNRRDSFYILKVHGDIDRIETVVLGRSDYREAMFANTAYREFLTALFLSRTVLFVGHSLTDPDFTLLLDEMQAAFKGCSDGHYALLSSKEAGPVERKRWQLDYGIQVIPYMPTLGHPEVSRFLSELAGETTKRRVMRAIKVVWRGLPHFTHLVVGASQEAQALFCEELVTLLGQEERDYRFHVVQMDLSRVSRDNIPQQLSASVLAVVQKEKPSLAQDMREALPADGLESANDFGHGGGMFSSIVDNAVAKFGTPQDRIVMVLRNAHELSSTREAFQWIRFVIETCSALKFVLLWGENGPDLLDEVQGRYGSPWFNVCNIVTI